MGIVSNVCLHVPPNVPFGDSGSLKRHLGQIEKVQLVCANFVRGHKSSNICQLVISMMAVSNMYT